MKWADVGVAGVPGVPLGVSEGTCIASSGLMTLLIVSTKCTIVSLLFSVSAAKIEILSSSGSTSAPLVGSLERATVTYCIIFAGWTMSIVHLNKQISPRASRPEMSDRFKIHLIESWSVRIVKRLLSRYGCKSRTVQTIARNPLYVLSYLRLASLREREQQLVGIIE